MADLEDRREYFLRGLVEPGEQLDVGTRHPGRSVPETVAVWILTDREQQLAYGRLGARQIDRHAVSGSEGGGASGPVSGPMTTPTSGA